MNQSKLQKKLEATPDLGLCSCRLCQKEVSLRARVCQNCGDPDPFLYWHVLESDNAWNKKHFIAGIVALTLFVIPPFPVWGLLVGGPILWWAYNVRSTSSERLFAKVEEDQKSKLAPDLYANWARGFQIVKTAIRSNE